MAHGKRKNIHEVAGVRDVHYDKNELLKDYQLTFRIFVTGLMCVVLAAVAYFFALAVYLGGWGQTKAAPFVKEFGDRAMPTYKGLKLPEFGGPQTPPHEQPTEEKK